MVLGAVGTEPTLPAHTAARKGGLLVCAEGEVTVRGTVTWDLKSLCIHFAIPNAKYSNARAGSSYECNELELDAESLTRHHLERARHDP